MNVNEAIQKAMKLLNKGNNAATSPEESAAFLAKAQQIIDDYKLDISSFNHDQNAKDDDAEPICNYGDEDPLDKVKYGQYRETWTRRLASVIANHNQARIVYTRHEDKSITIKIIGRASDVQIVRYMYGFFKLQVEELSAAGCKGNSSAFRGQFCMGVIDILWTKLNKERNATINAKRSEQSSNPMALVRVNNAVARMEKRNTDVEKFMKENMKLGKGRSSSFKTNTGGRQQGQLAGEKIRMTAARAAVGAGSRGQLN